MNIKGYRAKIKQGSVHFWHICALSQRRTYNQKWPIQAVCNYLLQVLQGTAGAAASLETFISRKVVHAHAQDCSAELLTPFLQND